MSRFRFRWGRASDTTTPLTTGLVLAVLVVACLLPFIAGDYVSSEFSAAMYLALGVLGMNLLTGFNGQLSLGHAAFFGLGAYIAGVLVADQGWTYPAAAAAAIAAVGVAGILIGIPALRIRGLYMALTTLALGLVFPQFIEKFQGTTGGSAGKAVPPPAVPAWLNLSPGQFVYFVSLAFLVAASVLVRNLIKSRLGRAIVAVRDHDLVAEAFGVRLAPLKVLVFGASAAVAAAGGVLLLMGSQFLAPGDYTLSLSIDFFVGMAIGGSTSVLGAVVGGLFLEFAPVYLPDLQVSQQWTPVLYAAILIGFIYLMPDGIAGGAQRLIRPVTGPRAQSGPPGPAGQGEPATGPLAPGQLAGTGSSPPESPTLR